MRRRIIILFYAAILSISTGCGDSVVRPGGISPQPVFVIVSPPYTVSTPSYSRYVRFEWQPSEDKAPAYSRYLWSEVRDATGAYNPGFDFIRDLNTNPDRYEQMWSPWARIDQGGGLSAVLGDDETLALGRYHFLAVQGRDNSGNVTTVFDKTTCVRHFFVKTVFGPYLKVYEPLLGGFRFIGGTMYPSEKKLPPGIELRFRWTADTEQYNGEIDGYRYGWDIPDVTSWDAPFIAGETETPATTFNSGMHTLFIQAADRGGYSTLARIAVQIIDWPMSRDLMWVDDFYSTNSPIPDYSWPPEYEHDSFWLSVCSRAPGFDPATDVFDCSMGLYIPGIQRVGRYRNIVWTFSGGNDVWSRMVRFTPESMTGDAETSETNLLSVFLRKGGHLWTLGRSDRRAGLAAVLPTPATIFPIDLECESAGIRIDCGGDRSGTESMAYRDYCVTVIDKICGIFRLDENMPFRSVPHFDVMRYALRDDADPVTSSYVGLPERLELRPEVTAEGSYFSTDSLSVPGGFTYVEVYDPSYWMDPGMKISRTCFHPLYRMRSASEYSALDHGAVAIWITSYEDMAAETASGPGVAAPSVHFGFPLWFFRESSVDSIADVIFERWGINR